MLARKFLIRPRTSCTHSQLERRPRARRWAIDGRWIRRQGRYRRSSSRRVVGERHAPSCEVLFDRHESLLVHPKRHATQIRVKIGAKKDGHLTAVETELYGDTGAYASLGEKVMTRATTHSAGPYEVPHVRADCYAMYTNIRLPARSAASA